MKFTKFGFKFLCLFLLVAFVPLGIAGTIVYKYVHDKTKEEVLRQLRSMSHSLNDQLNLLLSKRRFRVVDFSSDGFIRDCVEQMSFLNTERSIDICEKLNSHLIVNKKKLDPDILEIEILNPKGKVIASTLQEQISKDKSHKDYFRVPFLSVEQRGSYFGNNLERTETTDELRLVFSTILRDKVFQRPIGVIVTKVKGDILNNILDQNSYHSDKESVNSSFDEIYIINSDKVIIASSIVSNNINFMQIIDIRIVRETLATKTEFSGIYKNYRGAQVLGTVLFVPETKWVIMAEKNVKEAFLPLARIRNIFSISGGGVLFLVTIFAFVISKDANNIIKKLLEGFKSVETGDFGHKIMINKRWDERQNLAISFNSMTKKLKESKELESKFNEIKMLDSLTEKINAGFILRDVLNYVFESFRVIIPYERIGVAFLVDKGETVEHKWTRSDATEIKLDKGYSAKLEQTTLNSVIITGKPRIIKDLREYLKERPQSDSTKRMVEEGMQSSLTCPLIALGRPIGFMFFSSFKVNAYSNVHVELFKQIAGQLAVIVEKSRLYQKLEELNELKNGFLGMAAHDLQNPNNLIRLYLNQLTESLGDNKKDQHVWISKMHDISDSMLALIDDFLDISTIEAGQLQLKLEPVLPDVFFTNCFEANKLLIKEKSITLKLDLEKGLTMVDIDSDRINQVLNNLIANAMKYSIPNTEIILSARKIEDVLEVSVIDQGQGIPQNDIHKLFKMFGKANVRPTAGEKSTGLGLVICKHIVEAHGGRIWVESEGTGKGATFKFTLPLKCNKEELKG